MGSLLSALANILFQIISGPQLLGGSANLLGKLVEEMLNELRRKWLGWTGLFDYLTHDIWVVSRRYLSVALYIGALLSLGLAAGLWLFFFIDKRSQDYSLWRWLFLTSLVISGLPLISRLWLRRHPRLRVVLELAILSAVLLIFATRVLHLPVWHVWALFTVLLILLVGAGGRGVELAHAQIDRDLRHEWKNAAPASSGPTHDKVDVQLTSIHQYFFRELITYSALPAGILLGWLLLLLWGRSHASPPLTIVSVCLRCIFALAALVLLYFLGASFRRMIHPTLHLDRPPDLDTGRPEAFDWGCVMTAYRKMFLVDAVDNIVLLVTVSLLEWLLWRRDLALRDPKVITICVAATILWNEVPYLIGQWRVHELLCKPYSGWVRNTKMKEALENIPLAPKLEFIAALIGEASIGGLALEVMKQITELIGPASRTP